MTTTRSQGLPNVGSLKHIYRRQSTKVISRTRLSHECASAVPSYATSTHKRKSRGSPPPNNDSYHTHRCLTASILQRVALKSSNAAWYTLPPSHRVVVENKETCSRKAFNDFLEKTPSGKLRLTEQTIFLLRYSENKCILF